MRLIIDKRILIYFVRIYTYQPAIKNGSLSDTEHLFYVCNTNVLLFRMT